MKKLTQKLLTAALLLTMTAPLHLQASTIGVIDSGLDIFHPDLASKIWANPFEMVNGLDDDNNGLIDDINGWNFFSDNDELLGSFDHTYASMADIKKFLEIESISYVRALTSFEVAWAKAKYEDEKFLNALNLYTNYAHGTHVSGISSKNNSQAKLLALRLIADEEDLSSLIRKKFGAKLKKLKTLKTNAEIDPALQKETIDEILEAIVVELKDVALSQNSKLYHMGQYLNKASVQVVNGSYGTGFQLMAENIYVSLIDTIGDYPEIISDCVALTKAYIDYANGLGKGVVEETPKVLFVFAAGNEGTDNDDLGDYPSGIDADNVISVAASLSDLELPSFSNFGKKRVHVAAPGVGIESTVPEATYVLMTGTSQAAPYVTAVAAKMFDINPKLTPKEVKEILMATVDKKDFLEDKVVSGGIVNEKRALEAAKLMRTQDKASSLRSVALRHAIALSFKEVVASKSAHNFKSLKNKKAKIKSLSSLLGTGKSSFVKRPSSLVFKK